MANDPDALRAAGANLRARDAGWTKRLASGLKMLCTLDLARSLDLSVVER